MLYRNVDTRRERERKLSHGYTETYTLIGAGKNKYNFTGREPVEDCDCSEFGQSAVQSEAGGPWLEADPLCPDQI